MSPIRAVSPIRPVATSRSRLLRVLPAALLAGALVLASGCGADESGDEGADRASGDVTPEQARDRVVTASRDVAATLGALGEVADLGGAWAVCGSPPAEAVEYRASGVLRAADAPEVAVPAAADALAGAGWAPTGEGSDPQPWANLERDGTTVSLRVDPRRGSGGVAVAVADACVPVGDGESSDYDFGREPIEVP